METLNKNSIRDDTTHSDVNQIKEKTEFRTRENNVVNLIKKELKNIDNMTIPFGLTHLYLSHNKLDRVPEAILKLEHLQELDLSFNLVESFDIIPIFCFEIKYLNLSNNNLTGPPYWVWSKSPKQIIKLDLSNNTQLTKSFSLKAYCFQQFLNFKCWAQHVKIHNCGLVQHIAILSTFVNLRQLQLGEFGFSYKYANNISDIPSHGLEKCKLEKVNLSNNLVYSMNPNIKLLSNLVEIDLSQNKLRGLPNEFCELKQLEVCILSHNYLLYLPDNIVKLSNLRCLKLNSNDICMLPDNLTQLDVLKYLDLYDNALYEVPENIYTIQELDVGQNYFDEPIDMEYIIKKDKLRAGLEFDRVNGRKPEPIDNESEHSSFEDESYVESLQNTKDCEQNDEMSSSSEDWDSDDYWIPHNVDWMAPTNQSTWLSFVKRKMAEGNFCPMDAHDPPVSELVKYEQLCNPQAIYESEGQFDDFSEDD